jgi:hypothetical protein
MTLPHTLLAGVAKLMALQYAQTLYVGATVDETDLKYCEPFAHELPAALEAHGLRLVGGVCERIERATEAA